ncbi:hypothetical protein NL676_034532 [Syzygium grande]|nr:hypothetical protein NL676_034532 [Syzygium grande]
MPSNPVTGAIVLLAPSSRRRIGGSRLFPVFFSSRHQASASLPRPQTPTTFPVHLANSPTSLGPRVAVVPPPHAAVPTTAASGGYHF